jgi:hypothetical protein
VAVPHDPTAFLNAWETMVKAAWLDAVSVTWTMDSIRVRCINDIDDPYTELVVADPGTIVGEALPAQNSMVISKGSAIRGRWAQGRMHVAGVPESGSAGNAITAGQLTLLAALAVLLNTNVVVAGGNAYRPFIFSQRYSQITETPTDVVGNDQTTMVARSIIGSMDSRRTKVS